ncbi:tetratricopeptide repeat protein 4 [Eucyclogobius newberryi]|uniref:tetratricopeptide repeat protein 4 n=1 Tax=Eucyclogobius newberryi TaxID=166745 RepID=UPI003B58B96E
MGDDGDDDVMDAFIDRFKTEKYKNAFSEENWEEEMDRIPLFMTKAPDVVDPEKYPQLAALQSMIYDEDRTPEEKAEDLKNEGNSYFKKKLYKPALLSYTAALKMKSDNPDLDTVIFSNRAATHFYLGNMRSALNDATAAKKLKPDHLKALVRGAQCCVELRKFAEALKWCDEGLKLHPEDKKLQELRAVADKLKRAADRDARKAKVKEKKLLGEKETLLNIIKERGIKFLPSARPRRGSDSDEEEKSSSPLSLDGLSSQEVTGAQVHVNPEDGALYWPVLFLYPEHQQSDFISAFCENHSFSDHLSVMFGEELPPWDTDRKYRPSNLQLFFEDEQNETLYQVDAQTSLLQAQQHRRYFVKAGTPSFILLVKDSPFCQRYLSDKKVHRL